MPRGIIHDQDEFLVGINFSKEPLEIDSPFILANGWQCTSWVRQFKTPSGALSELREYQDKVAVVKEQSTEVKEGNQMVIDFILSPGGESSFPDSAFRSALNMRAFTNRESAEDVETWADTEPANIEELRQELGEGAFLTDYNQMVSELGQSLST